MQNSAFKTLDLSYKISDLDDLHLFIFLTGQVLFFSKLKHIKIALLTLYTFYKIIYII